MSIRLLRKTPLGLAIAAGMVAGLPAASVDAATVGVRISFGTTVLEFYDNDASGNDLNSDPDTIDFNLGTSAGGALFSALGFSALEVDGARCTLCANTLTLDVEASNQGSTTPLEVLVSGINFTNNPLEFRFLHSGILPGGTVTTEAYVDPGNAFFGMTQLIGSASFANQPYGDVLFGPGTASPHSQTLRMLFGFENQTQTLQSQSQLTGMGVIPLPATLPLMLGGLGALAALGLRRRRTG